MVNFEGQYWHPMDRNYAMPNSIQKYLPRDIGISTPPMKDQLQALKARIFQGAQHAELGFWNQGLHKGSMTQGSPSPEMYGKDERQAIKEVAKVNKISLSTHASPLSGNLAGMHEGNFTEHNRYEVITDMKRAVEFAADVAEGGPVVVHAGEYPREVHEVKGEEGKLFKAFPGAEKETVHYLIDQRQGKIVSTVREDQKNFVPVIKGTNKSVWGEDLRELERDMKSGNIKIVEKKWDEYLKQSNNNPDEASKAFFRDTLSRQKMQAVGQANQFEITNHEQREKAEKLQASLKWWEKNEPHLTDAGKKMYMHKDPILSEYHVKQDEYTPTEWLKKQLWEIQKSISYGQETAAAARTQIAELEEMEKNTKPLGEFAVEKSADSIAELGIYAMKQEKMKGLDKPIFIAPENIFPEQYGGHPQELKELIIKSRERMVERLVNEQKVSKSVAEKAAAEHIKATFDIGHANTWRRYFKGDPKDFDKWLLKQVDDLQRSGVIGHIHMTDNFGYVDEHVTPGQGNVPVEKFMEHLKRSGYQGKIIIEPSHQDYQSWLGALKASQSPIYRIDGASKTWTDIESGYFGQTRSPRYIFGPYAPDEKAWSLWSEVPLE